MENLLNISTEKRESIYNEFDKSLFDVNLSDIENELLFDTLYNIASDMLIDEYFETENIEAKKGNRDFNILNQIRCNTITNLITNYLNKTNY